MKGISKLWLRSFLWCGVCLISVLIQIFSPETKALFCTPLQLPGMDATTTPGSSMERIK
jgi:hypothetical protein